MAPNVDGLSAQEAAPAATGGASERSSLLPVKSASGDGGKRKQQSIILSVCSFILVTEVRAPCDLAACTGW